MVSVTMTVFVDELCLMLLGSNCVQRPPPEILPSLGKNGCRNSLAARHAVRPRESPSPGTDWAERAEGHFDAKAVSEPFAASWTVGQRGA